MMTEFAHNSGLLTIAEYVESQVLQDELLRIGVDYSQGYLIGKPAPLD
jgi:EAL domain-containing protein (putative c-di-GMP-specific phosphodiesterase class I)